MPLYLIETHLLLAFLMFYLINWLGRYSSSMGYMSLSAFYTADEAPAFNLLFRVFSPVVFIVLVASILYSLGLDEFVKDIWLVTLFSCAIRLAYILIFDRTHLINWDKEISTWLLTTGLTWAVYTYFVVQKSYLLPEPNELKNQFWIIIILYVYSIANSLYFDSHDTKSRKFKYLDINYKFFKSKFGKIIATNSPDVLCQSLIYSVLLNENFNRPKMIRGIEHFVFPWLSKTLGPMQVRSTKRLSDMECVNQGSKIIADAYIEATNFAKQYIDPGVSFDPYTNYRHMEFLRYKIAAKYNRDDEYVRSINEMHNHLLENFYPTFLPSQPQPNSIDDFLNRGW